MIKIVEADQLQMKRKVAQGTVRQQQKVKDILHQVQTTGDTALFELTEHFDQVRLARLQVTQAEIVEACAHVDDKFLVALQVAVERIHQYHEKQKLHSWIDTQTDGTILGQIVQPLARVGVYVPGGRAAYPSTVLMNVIPAVIAGVPEIVMVTPPQADGNVYPATLVAAKLVGVETIYKVGGAQAIAALAYGTQTIAAVDKIVGPGNIYVTLAKQAVYGQVDIDSMAGPSEIVVIADEYANPIYIAADLLAQAEHDPMSSAVLITPSRALADQVAAEIEKTYPQLERKEIVATSIQQHGAICVTKDLHEAFAVSNRLAPEHLELQIVDPWNWVSAVKHAGALFLGAYSPEPIGDYLAGPNHVIPTNGTARFSSPLNVDHFMKKTSLISYTRQSFLRDAQHVITLAHAEGLQAHAKSIQVRLHETATTQVDRKEYGDDRDY
jgi:histidinol dehydrogenase